MNEMKRNRKVAANLCRLGFDLLTPNKQLVSTRRCRARGGGQPHDVKSSPPAWHRGNPAAAAANSHRANHEDWAGLRY